MPFLKKMQIKNKLLTYDINDITSFYKEKKNSQKTKKKIVINTTLKNNSHTKL